MINVHNKQDLYEKLPLHKKWLYGEKGGAQLVSEMGADLSEANLSGANLRGADLPS